MRLAMYRACCAYFNKKSALFGHFGKDFMEKVVIRDCILYHADCMEVLPAIDNVQICVGDPPSRLQGSRQPLARFRAGRNGARFAIRLILFSFTIFEKTVCKKH